MAFGGFGGGNKSKGKSKGGGGFGSGGIGGALDAGRAFGSSFGSTQGAQSVGSQSVGGAGSIGGSRSRGNTGGQSGNRGSGGRGSAVSADTKAAVVSSADLSSTRDLNSATEAVASVDTSEAGQFADAFDSGFSEGFTTQGTAEIAGDFASALPGGGLISSIATKGIQAALSIGGETGLGIGAEKASGFKAGVSEAANTGITSSSLANKGISAALGFAGPIGGIINAGLTAHSISSNPNFQGGAPSGSADARVGGGNRGDGGSAGGTQPTTAQAQSADASLVQPAVEPSTPSIGFGSTKKAKVGLSFANAKKVKRKVKQRG